MNRKIVVLTALLALLIATPLMAQRQGRRGGGGFGVSKLQLAQAEPVQKELELVADQKEQIAKLAEEAQAARRGGGGGNFQDLSDEERAKRRQEQQARARETDKKVEAILVGPQKTRLNEIYVQALGTAALTNEDIAKELGIGADLQEKIETTRREAMQAAFQGGGGGGGFNPEAFAKARAEVDTKVVALLSAEQKEKFEKMKGKKVEFDLTAIGRGGRGQRRGGNQ
jgi:hypothetical protein